MDSKTICDFILINSKKQLSQMELNTYVFIINCLYYKQYNNYLLEERFIKHSLIGYYLKYIKINIDIMELIV